jgi:hypothetical protein
MQNRSYVLGLMAAAYVAFLGVIALNLVIDPEAVFGTGIFGVSSNSNERNLEWANFAAAPAKFDGLLLGSSRSREIPLAELSQRMSGVTFARFSVSYGMITDFLSMFEFVLRKKAETGTRLRAVFLLLDVDELGRANTDAAIQWMPPPALSGQSALRFWWTNLTAIQPKAWQFAVHKGRGGSGAEEANTSPAGAEDLGKPPVAAAGVASPDEAPASPADRASPGEAQPATYALRPFNPDPEGQTRVTTERDYKRQLKMVERLVALCRENNIELVVATPPLSHQRAAELDLRDFAKGLDDISRLVPIWDFSFSDWLPDSPDFWEDSVHFRPEIGHMMLMRIFRDQLPPPWQNFGKLRSANAPLAGAGTASVR